MLKKDKIIHFDIKEREMFCQFTDHDPTLFFNIDVLGKIIHNYSTQQYPPLTLHKFLIL